MCKLLQLSREVKKTTLNVTNNTVKFRSFQTGRINVTQRFWFGEGTSEEKFVVPNENELLDHLTRPFKASQSVP